MLSDTSAADSFFKTWRQKKKLLKTSKFFFWHHFLTVFNSYTFMYRGFPYFYPDVFSLLLPICCIHRKGLNPFPSFPHKSFLMLLQHTLLKTLGQKKPKCFQINLIIIISFTEMLHIFAKMVLNSSGAVLLYEEKGLTLSLIRQFCSRQLWTYFVKK